MSSHVNITFILEDKEIDLRIPTVLKVRDLIDNIFDIFSITKNKSNYHLKVVNKDIVILENEVLEDYPLSNGDIFKLI